MKTLIKRLLGITRLENEIIGSHAEIKAMADVILTTRTELAYYKGLVQERYETEWKITKDGKRRYRKIATKVLVNAWHTESEPIEPLDGQLYGTDTVVTGIADANEVW